MAGNFFLFRQIEHNGSDVGISDAKERLRGFRKN